MAWTSVEECLKHVDSADILVVFDCCHAGALSADHRTPFRFEFLGACNNGEITPKPGKNSFTSAMIWALRDLLKEQPGFHSVELQEKIKDYEGLKCDPVLFPRFQQQSAVPVWIEPMASLEEPQIKRSRTKQNDDAADATADWFDLRFHFKRGQEDKDVEQLVQSLKPHAQTLGLLRITAQDRALDPIRVKPHARSWLNRTRSPSSVRPPSNILSEPDIRLQTPVHSVVQVEGGEAVYSSVAPQLLSPNSLMLEPRREEPHSEDESKHPAIRRHSVSNPVGTRPGRLQKVPVPTKVLSKGRQT